MRYLALCCDYDGTIAHHGQVDVTTLRALEKLRASGRRLVLVTGRELDDLEKAFPHLDLFERVVAENGALIFRPATREARLLGEPPPLAFINELRARHVAPLSVGRVIVATWEPNETTVINTIRDLGLELQVIFNKGAVMILPAGVNKASGLKAALSELHLSPHNAVAVGDGENDHAFFSICECAVAVANALPALKDKADFVTAGDHGVGVSELIDEMIANDLANRESALARHLVPLGTDSSGAAVYLSPQGTNALVVGTSGGGKSTVAMGMVERLRAAGYSFCIIDPEGDYDKLADTVVLGGPNHAPSIDECLQLLANSDNNAIINLLGIKLHDRPRFFMSLFARINDLRAHTGHPHWVIVDEAHHVLPASWETADPALPDRLDSVLLVSVMPSLIAAPVLTHIDTLIVLGSKPKAMLLEFTNAIGHAPIDVAAEPLETGAALIWQRRADTAPLYVQLEPSRTERRRHLRKYAEGELPPDRSFFFRGADNKLKLRAQNLIQFMDLGDGVDDDTWLFHLQRGDYSRWISKAMKDDELAACIADIEHNERDDASESRQHIREFIEKQYTLPAVPPQRDAGVPDKL